MASTHEYKDLQDDVKRVHWSDVVAGVIVSVDHDNNTADITIDSVAFNDVPIFYHCPDKSTVDLGHSAFEDGDYVLVLVEKSSRHAVPAYTVIGFQTGELRTCLRDYVLAIRLSVNEASIEDSFLWDMQNHEYYTIDDPDNPGSPLSYPCVWSKLAGFLTEYGFTWGGADPPEIKDDEYYYAVDKSPWLGMGIGGEPDEPTDGPEATPSTIHYCDGSTPDTRDWTDEGIDETTDQIIDGSVWGHDCYDYYNQYMRYYMKTSILEYLRYGDYIWDLTNNFNKDYEAFGGNLDIHKPSGPDNLNCVGIEYKIATQAGNGDPYCFRYELSDVLNGSGRIYVYLNYGNCPLDVRMQEMGSGSRDTRLTLSTPKQDLLLRNNSKTYEFDGQHPGGGGWNYPQGYSDEASINEIWQLQNANECYFTKNCLVQSINIAAIYGGSTYSLVSTAGGGYTDERTFQTSFLENECFFYYDIYSDDATNHNPNNQNARRTVIQNVINSLAGAVFEASRPFTTGNVGVAPYLSYKICRV